MNYRQELIEGNSGKNGGDNREGLEGKDLHISVPEGTSIFQIKTSEEECIKI